jgi:hypothetical protein
MLDRGEYGEIYHRTFGKKVGREDLPRPGASSEPILRYLAPVSLLLRWHGPDLLYLTLDDLGPG